MEKSILVELISGCLIDVFHIDSGGDSAADYFSAEAYSSLKWIERQTYTRTNHAKMLVGWREGAFLTEFAKMVGARRILELGTFTGFSLLCLAEGAGRATAAATVADKGSFQIDAIEINDELEYIIREGVERSGYAKNIKIFFGDAKLLIPNLPSAKGSAPQYDLVFIDANKREYLQYYNLVFPLVKKGGYILADNVLWYGKGVGEAPQKADTKTQGIREFNSFIEKASADSSAKIKSHLLKLRDGLYIIQKTE